MAAALLAAACAEGDGEAARGDRLIPACAVPLAADTLDEETGVGCLPRTMFQICEVPEGSVIHADGSITTPSGERVTCSSLCTPEEYALACTGPPPDGDAPAPAAGLGCRVIPLPTPPNAAFHCCPCAPGAP